MTTNYYSMMNNEAEMSIRPLAVTLIRLTKELAKIKNRLEDSRAEEAQANRDIASLKATAGQRLTAGTESYLRYSVAFKKVTVRLATAKEITSTFTTDILPAKETQVADARDMLRKSLAKFCQGKKSLAEGRMATLIAKALEERTSFLDAAGKVYGDFAEGFSIVAYDLLIPLGRFFSTASSKPGQVEKVELVRTLIDATPPAIADCLQRQASAMALITTSPCNCTAPCATCQDGPGDAIVPDVASDSPADAPAPEAAVVDTVLYDPDLDDLDDDDVEPAEAGNIQEATVDAQEQEAGTLLTGNFQATGGT